MKLNKKVSTSFMTDCGMANARAVYTKPDNPSVLANNMLPFIDRSLINQEFYFCLIFLIIGVKCKFDLYKS